LITPKILIVDDEPSIRFALTEALKSWGYQSVQAGTVADAKHAIVEEEPAVALLAPGSTYFRT
jgi:DNA-binding response OmpR family regulator